MLKIKEPRMSARLFDLIFVKVDYTPLQIFVYAGLLLIGLLDIDKCVNCRCAEFDSAHLIIGVDYEIIDVVYAGLPLCVAVGREREFQQSVACCASYNQVFFRRVFIRP